MFVSDAWILSEGNPAGGEGFHRVVGFMMSIPPSKQIDCECLYVSHLLMLACQYNQSEAFECI
jgi:hypothetical protein